MKNYYDLNLKCKYNRLMKIAEEIGNDSDKVRCAKNLTIMKTTDKRPDLARVNDLRSEIIFYMCSSEIKTWWKQVAADL